jgi:hypothetical protein
MSYGAEKRNTPVSIVDFFPCFFSVPTAGPGGDPQSDDLCTGRGPDTGGNEGGFR